MDLSARRSFNAWKRQFSEPPPQIPPSDSASSDTSYGTTTQSIIDASHTTSNTLTVPTNTARPDAESAERAGTTRSDRKAIVLGVVGIIIVMVVLSYLLYRFLRRRNRLQRTMGMREKGALGEYSQVNDEFVNQEMLMPDAGEGNQSWWRSRGAAVLEMLSIGRGGRGSVTGAPRKQRQRTMYKVKRHKKGGSFEIDSEASSSVVDLRVVTR